MVPLCVSCGREPARLAVSWPDGAVDEVCPGCRPPRGRARLRRLDGPALVVPVPELERLRMAAVCTAAGGWELLPAPPAALALLGDLARRAELDDLRPVDDACAAYDGGAS